MCIFKNYIKLKVGIICIILLVFIFCSATIVYSYIQESTITQDKNNDEIINSTDVVERNVSTEKIEYVLNDKFNENWYIEIPQIGLLAPISEGTTQEVMSKYVGHFDNTNVWDGNIGLAAHNRRMSSKLFWKN